MRFVRGHSGRRIEPDRAGLSPPNPSGRCMCGCGRATRIAPRTDLQLGWVKDTPIRFIRGHHGRLALLFAADVDYRVVDHGHATPCWIWLRARSDDYGCVWRQRNGRREPTLAHRLSYEHHCGPIGNGLVIDHLCGMKLCVNPSHLECVSSAENTRRAAARRGATRDRCVVRPSARRRRVRYTSDNAPYDIVVAGYETPCWIWQRAVTWNGYPTMSITRLLKTRRRQLYAHRVYWARAHGPVPRGYQVDHLCGNTRCVNPGHLEPVPPSVHRDRTAARRRSLRAS